jgi:hypothetical protein
MNFRDCISMPLVPFCSATGLGRTTIYSLIAAEEIKSITVGKRRFSTFSNARKKARRRSPRPTRGRARELLLRSAQLPNGMLRRRRAEAVRRDPKIAKSRRSLALRRRDHVEFGELKRAPRQKPEPPC